MRFCPWYPLAQAGEHAPDGENVLQLRVADGLIDYPTGKSAMVRYSHATDARMLATRWAAELSSHALLCRHLEIVDGDCAALTAKLLAEFTRRFGAEPSLP